MAASKDYYQVLGVAETATVDEIKKAFRRLAKQYHPERNPTNAQAAERFKEINEAHDVLSDPEKRKRYDQLRRYGAYAGAGRGGGAGAPGSGGAEFDLSDLGSFGGLGGLFSRDRESTRLNSSHGYISYAGFCLKKKKTSTTTSSTCTV